MNWSIGIWECLVPREPDPKGRLVNFIKYTEQTWKVLKSAPLALSTFMFENVCQVNMVVCIEILAHSLQSWQGWPSSREQKSSSRYSERYQVTLLISNSSMLTSVNRDSVRFLLAGHYCNKLVSFLVIMKVLPAMMSDSELKVCVAQIR